MLSALKLILPAIIPSWNFFDVIAPSPRIEFAIWDVDEQSIRSWSQLRRRPDSVSLLTMLRRLFWNPQWNESLYLVSLAERLVVEPSSYYEEEIFHRIISDLAFDPPTENAIYLVQFRLLFKHRVENEIVSEQSFVSKKRIIDLSDKHVS